MELDQETPHEKTNEEDHILHRSNKRVRSRENIEEPTRKDVDLLEKNKQHVSFRDKLLGQDANNDDLDPEEWILDDENGGSEADEEQCCPVIRMSREEKLRIRKPWKQSLIVKLLGRPIGYRTLLSN